jgi:twitching motility two-component system response regulator PilH
VETGAAAQAWRAGKGSMRRETVAQILIVDDSPTELHVLKGMLEKNGHQVITAGNGEEGVQAAKDNHPDLILMDVVMPGLNGFQATRQLSRDTLTRDIPIIIVSTKSQETDRVWGMRQGARDYLTKPVAEADLMAKVSALLAG